MQVLIATAPGVTNARSNLGTPMVLAGLVLTAAGTVVFPSTLAYLSNQVQLRLSFALQLRRTVAPGVMFWHIGTRENP